MSPTINEEAPESGVPTQEDEEMEIEFFPLTPPSERMVRTLGLIGDVDEETSKAVISSLWLLKDSGGKEVWEDDQNPESEILVVFEPIEMLISTNGGNADDMFAIYDVMRMTREFSAIHTIGIGKVMSAGTLLLAAGTKGQRRVGKHCRIMIHSVIAGTHGPMHQLDNEMKEFKYIQDMYIKALVEETNLTEKQLKSLLKRKTNVYLTAEEAVEWGFADIIV